MQERQIAYRVLPPELADSTEIYVEDERDEKSPKYLISPLGAMINRIFISGVLSNIQEKISSDGDTYYTARINTFGRWGYLITAGRYQPEIASKLANLQENDGEEYVAIVGKVRLLPPREGYSRPTISVKPENLTVVDEDTYNFWLLEACRHTIMRIKANIIAGNIPNPSEEILTGEGIPEFLAKGIILARDRYGGANLGRYISMVRGILDGLANPEAFMISGGEEIVIGEEDKITSVDEKSTIDETEEEADDSVDEILEDEETEIEAWQ